MQPCRQPAPPRRRRQRRRSRTSAFESSHFDDSPTPLAINWKAMSSYREFLQEARGQIEEIDAERARELHDANAAVFLDVREREEWDEGHIPAATHIPRGWLESRIEQALPDHSRAIVAYCASGNRSTFAARTLEELGYENVVSLGEAKVESASRTIRELNPDVEVKAHKEQLTSENIERILSDGWDVIVDGADNFPTRYLVNDAAVWHDIPLVHGSIFRFEGQATVFKPHEGPCYRCLFPQPPPPELAPSCAEGGVLGVLPGVIGSLQASEAIKLALGIGEPLIARLLLFDALTTTFTEVALRRDPDCPVCGENPTINEYIDYVEFCNPVRA